MYINRKTGELVEAEWVEKVSAWNVKDGFGITIALLSTATFNAQYGEAMICPKEECQCYCECPLAQPHICDDTCDDTRKMKCPACIPYIPEQKDPDEGLKVRPEIIERLEKSKQIPKEELLTSGQMREKLGIEQSNLMLSEMEGKQ